jgi:hypothetical protein
VTQTGVGPKTCGLPLLGRSRPSLHRAASLSTRCTNWTSMRGPPVATDVRFPDRLRGSRLRPAWIVAVSMLTSAQCRAAHGLIDCNQQQLADAAGVATVRLFEAGKGEPRVTKVRRHKGRGRRGSFRLLRLTIFDVSPAAATMSTSCATLIGQAVHHNPKEPHRIAPR